MITGTLSVDDYIAAHRLFYRRTRKVMYLVSTILFLIGIAIVYAYPRSWWGSIITFGGIGGFFGNLYGDLSGLPSKVRAIYHQFKGISDPITVSWDSEYLEGKNAEGSGRRKWRDYVRVKEDDRVFLLYLTDNLWHVYPKRWFASQDQINEFRSYASKAGEI